MHGEEIVHRDIKPENILFHKGKLILADFGFAKQLNASKDIMNSVKYTPQYGAPELVKGKGYTKKADVYSIASILSEVLVGQHPDSNLISG